MYTITHTAPFGHLVFFIRINCKFICIDIILSRVCRPHSQRRVYKRIRTFMDIWTSDNRQNTYKWYRRFHIQCFFFCKCAITLLSSRKTKNCKQQHKMRKKKSDIVQDPKSESEFEQQADGIICAHAKLDTHFHIGINLLAIFAPITDIFFE